MGQSVIATTCRVAAHVLCGGLDLLYPRQCLACEEPLADTSNPLCPVCASAVRVEREIPACPACAGTVAPYEVANDTCQACRERPTRLAGSVRVGVYRGALAGLLRAYKFRDAEHLGELLIAWLTDAVRQAPWVERTEAIVPVPTHWSRRLRRRYYPADQLAAGVARRTGRALIPLLRRVRAGRHQIGLSYSARVENVRGAFTLRRGFKLRDARVLLVDDVKTTGATIEECAKVLLHAGAVEVYAATVVRADQSASGEI